MTLTNIQREALECAVRRCLAMQMGFEEMGEFAAAEVEHARAAALKRLLMDDDDRRKALGNG